MQWLACLSCKRETAVQIPVVAHFYGNLLIFIEGSISPCIDFYHRMFCFPSVNCESIAFPQPPPISLVSDCTGYGARSKNAVVTVSDSEGLITEMADNLCGRWDGQLDADVSLIVCTEIKTGRYVQLQFFETEIMNLREIEVHGY